MGCKCNNCLAKNQENSNEMVDGIIPIKTEGDDINHARENDENNEDDINKNKNPILKAPVDKIEKDKNEESLYDSSIVSKLQELNESISEYFNQVRTSPEKFGKEAEEHDVGNIIQKVINSSTPCRSLIINPFYNSLLSSYFNDDKNDGDNNYLLDKIEKEEQFTNYNKKLFNVEGDLDDSNEIVWKLIENNKDIAYETFFSNSIECFAICCKQIEDKKINCYFLFLSKQLEI